MRIYRNVFFASLFCLSTVQPSFGHGNHQHFGSAGTLGGVLGVGLNLLELGKHGLVVVDQLSSDEKNTQVLVGNALVGVSHFINAKAFLDELSKGKQERYALPLMLLANSFNFWDLYVDGITAWEYWSKESSWQNTAIMLAAPACFVLNLHMLVSHSLKQKKS